MSEEITMLKIEDAVIEISHAMERLDALCVALIYMERLSEVNRAIRVIRDAEKKYKKHQETHHTVLDIKLKELERYIIKSSKIAKDRKYTLANCKGK